MPDYTYIHTYTSGSLLGARYGGFIPKGYVAIVLTRIAATMAGYSSALNTDFAPESARRMQRSAIDAIRDAWESSVYAITRYIPYVLRNCSDIKELLNYLILTFELRRLLCRKFKRKYTFAYESLLRRENILFRPYIHI